MSNLKHSDFRIRKLIGILGISIPIVLPFLSNWEVLSSISHYYYLTAPSLYFIIVMSSLGLFLISYKGYIRDKGPTREYISDDWLTNIAGISVLVLVLVPTACDESGSGTIDDICKKFMPLFGHVDKTKDNIHLIAAGLFVLLMGWMSFFKFSINQDKKGWRYKLYKTNGVIIWIAVLSLIIYFVIGFKIDNFVFWMEVIVLVPFGISWLVKGETMEALSYMINLTKSKLTEGE